MKKKENYLERIPKRAEHIKWSLVEDENVTLEIENNGIFNRIAQKFFKKPPISYIHLDKMGSFIWPLIDGEKSILELSKNVSEHFGEDANPLFERLCKFFQILESYGFITYK